MFLTAKEMTEKLCPQLVVEGEFATCESSVCAAWQWGESEDIAHPEARRGFCGLAGVPAEFTLEMQARLTAARSGLREVPEGIRLVQPAPVPPPKKRN